MQAFRRGSPLVPQLSREISKLRENGILKMLEDKWFKSDSVSMDSEPASRIQNLKAYRDLFLISGVSMTTALLIFSLNYIQEKVYFTSTMLGEVKLAFIMRCLKST